MPQSQANEKDSDIRDRLGPIIAFAIQAAQEGGHRVDRDVGAKLLSGYFVDREARPPYKVYEASSKAGYRATATIGPVGPHDPEGRKDGELVIELLLPGSIDARVTLSRRTDEPRWKATTVGTYALPTGHPLGTLAHDDRFLGLAQERTVRELEDRDAERGLMEMARILEREKH